MKNRNSKTSLANWLAIALSDIPTENGLQYQMWTAGVNAIYKEDKLRGDVSELLVETWPEYKLLMKDLYL